MKVIRMELDKIQDFSHFKLFSISKAPPTQTWINTPRAITDYF